MEICICRQNTKFRMLHKLWENILSTKIGYFRILFLRNLCFFSVLNECNFRFWILLMVGFGMFPKKWAFSAAAKIVILWDPQIMPIFLRRWKFFRNCVSKWKNSSRRLYCLKSYHHTIQITNFRLFPKFTFFPKKVTDQYILHFSKVHFT